MQIGSPNLIIRGCNPHKLARIIYRFGQSYVDEEMENYEQKYQNRLLKNLTKTAESMGLQLIPKRILYQEFLRKRHSRTLLLLQADLSLHLV